MCNFIQHKGPKTLTIVPRGHYKTTIGAEGYPLFRLINDCNDTILLGNAVLGNARKFLQAIKNHIEKNEIFRWVYPELIPGPNDKWTTDEICVPRTTDVKEPSVMAIGVGGTAVSLHFRCLIEDDLVNEDHLISAEQMEKVVDWHKYAMSLLVQPETDRELVQGTRWAFYDVYSHIQDNEKDFEVFFRSDRDDNDEPIFPEEFSDEALKKIEARQGPYIYSCQYRNEPADPTKAVIRQEWLVYIDDLEEEKQGRLHKFFEACRCYVIIDPAGGDKQKRKRDNDYTGMVVCFVDHQYNVYVEYADRERIPPSDVIDRTFRFVELYNPSGIGMELVSLAKGSYQLAFEQEMRNRKKWFYLEPLQPNTHQTKEMRVRNALQPLFAQRKVFIRRSQTALREELLKFPLGRHDDIIDALAYLPQMWNAGDSPKSEEDKSREDPFNMSYILEKFSHQLDDTSRYPFVLTPERRRN